MSVRRHAQAARAGCARGYGAPSGVVLLANTCPPSHTHTHNSVPPPPPPPPPTRAPPCMCSNLCAIHAKRVTIQVKDLQLARRIRGLHDLTG